MASCARRAEKSARWRRARAARRPLPAHFPRLILVGQGIGSPCMLHSPLRDSPESILGYLLASG